MPQFDTVDRTIRNQRFRAWPAAFACLLAVVSWLAMCWFVISGGAGDHVLVLLWCLGVSLFTICGFIVYLNWLNPVHHLRLGNNLEIRPRARPVLPSEVVSVSFGPDPAEDYVESTLPIAVCEATVRLRKGRPLRLIISAGDAARFREWACLKGIAVNDPDGYSTLVVRNEPS